MGCNLMISWFYYLSSPCCFPQERWHYEGFRVIKLALAKTWSSSHQEGHAVPGAAGTISHRLSIQRILKAIGKLQWGRHDWPRMTSGPCVLTGCYPQILLVPERHWSLKLAVPAQSLVWDFSPYVSYMSRDSWLAGRPHTISHRDLKFTMFQTELIISYLPRSASLFLPWWMRYSATQWPELQCLESSSPPPSCLPWVSQPRPCLAGLTS